MMEHVYKISYKGLLAGWLMLLVLSPSAWAQNDPLAPAKEAYLDGDFEKATELFYGFAKDANEDIEVRKDALRYLGRAYIATDLVDEARGAIQELLELEPPLVALDADIEAPPLMELYWEVRHEYEGTYRAERADDGIQTLAVIDFTNGSIGPNAGDYDPLQKGLSSMMINYLHGATNLKVIERERLNWLLAELELQQDPKKIDQQTAVRAGKLLGAHAVLIGSFIVVNTKQMYMGSRLVDVETGEILLAEMKLGQPDKFFELVEKLSNQVADAINVEIDNPDLGANEETRSLEAMMKFSEGLELLENQNYRAAYQLFQEALEIDPNFERAKLKAESIRPLIG